MPGRCSIRPEMPMDPACRLSAGVEPRNAGNRDYVVRRAAKRTGYTRAVVNEITRAFLIELMQVVTETGYVEFNGFGTWGLKRYTHYWNRDPRTGKGQRVPVTWRMRFHASRAWKDVIKEHWHE